MGSTHPPGPALVTASADADPVTLLVLGWLAAKRSENTRAAYGRDIGITPQRRASRAPSWLAWCQEQGVHPVTGVTGLHVARYARQLDAAGLSPASAARKLAAVSGWYAWLAQRGHLGTERGHRVLRVTRTNGRRQSLALPGPAASRIDAYLAGRPGLAGVPVLFATRTGGRLFAADVRQAVRRLATRAELPADLASHLGPRMMRHSFAALYLDAGRSFRDLQSAMGYAEPRTTRRYDQARHTAVIHLARPQQRHRAPPQPAYQARDPSSGPWPGSRSHCRARRPQHAREPTRNQRGKAEGNRREPDLARGRSAPPPTRPGSSRSARPPRRPTSVP